jgi:uncharacterized membrane protein
VRDEPTRSSLHSTAHVTDRPTGQPKGMAALLGGAALVAYAVYKGSNKQREARHHEASPAPRDEALPNEIDATVTIGSPRQEVYTFWKQLENLPLFMKHLESVEDLGNGRSRWVAKTPAGGRVEWEAETLEDRAGELLSWRSVPGSQVYNAGTVRFENASGGRGTAVKVHLEFVPPGGAAGRAAARLLGPITSQQVREDLRRFKNLMEAGEIPTISGQSAGRRHAIHMRNPL